MRWYSVVDILFHQLKVVGLLNSARKSRKGNEEIWKASEGYMFLGSGWQRGHRGVAIILHKRTVSGFNGFYPASKRAGAVDVDIRGAKVRFEAAYLPDSSYDDVDVEATYYQLDGLCSKAQVAKRNIVIGGATSTLRSVSSDR